ncbi:3-deoxy-7-phosphoheptulonate synthase [Catenulispora sp. EB89]|uniref:3-deoxy-7-phosphoheptulonate synthase n=1 Tax=Catenulispora sp. EB89 TaxID=3156257 RepID=UPI00351499B2
MRSEAGERGSARSAPQDFDEQSRREWQQPDWDDHPDRAWALGELSRAAPLVSAAELRQLREGLAAAAEGESLVLQAGDCAESFAEGTPSHIAQKLHLLRSLATELSERDGRRVLQIGRIGGQFAKPRSHEHEHHGGRDLPAFRGHLINSEIPTTDGRQHDPARMVIGHGHAAQIHRLLDNARENDGAGPWSSHEALVLDYEKALMRGGEAGGGYLSSTHLPWIGERTRRADGPHVRLLAPVQNPVGCKVGPSADPEELVRTCDALDPFRIAGRLVLITRMGWRHAENRLRAVVRAVAAAGHRPVWLCDPMHGNTVVTSDGVKTRFLSHIAAEVRQFRRVLNGCGVPASGLHLEVSADQVTECVGADVPDPAALKNRYTTLCDPRLNPRQALEVVSVWC